MAERLIPITNLSQGMSNDTPTPGTLREILNMFPWRGSLRRRGPVKRFTTISTTTTSFAGEPAEAAYNKNNINSGKTLFAIDTSASSAELYAAPGTYSYSVIATTSPVARIVPVGGEMFVFPRIVDATDTNKWVTRWNGADPSSSLPSMTGNVTLTAGSKHAVFANPIAADAVRGGYIQTTTGLPNRKYGLTKAISTTTALMSEPARVSYTGSWSSVGAVPLQASLAPASGGLFVDFNNGAGPYGADNSVVASAGTVHAGRLFVGNILDGEWSGTAGTIVHKPARIRWSALGGASDANNFSHYQNFNEAARLDLGDDGGPILGLSSLNGALVVIRRSSVQVVTGAFATSGVDLGATVNTVIRSAGAGSFHAWEEFDGGIAFADERGVYVWDGAEVTNLTRNAIERTYRGSAETKRLIVTCPGNRIVVWYENSPGNLTGYMYDMVTKGWFRLALDGPYSRFADTGTEYLALRNQAINLGGGAMAVRIYNMMPVFEDLDTAAADRALDEDNTLGSTAMNTYVLTNPIPIVDGIQEGRVNEVIISDGGLSDFPESMNYKARLLSGSIYSGDLYSGESGLASQDLGGDIVIPQITGATADQRVVRVRANGSEPAQSVMVEITKEALSQTATFAHSLNAIGLLVEGENRFDSA